jgi:hypothetical protein
VSDFTIADCWGIEKVHPEFDDNLGCTTMILHTSKAGEVYSKIEKNLAVCQYSIEDVIKYNPYIKSTISLHPKTEEFYNLYRSDGIRSAAEKYCKYKKSNILVRIYNKISKKIHYKNEN